jgi:hypothetical protein
MTMKKILLLTVALVWGSLSVYAGIYHETDKAALRTFLSQTTKNYDGEYNNWIFGANTTNWTQENVETWVNQVTGIVWR